MDKAKKVRQKLVTITDYKDTFNCEKGRRILYDMCKQFHFFQTSFYEDNAHVTSFREGERNVINYILTKIKQDVSVWEDMLKRHEEEINETKELY